MNRESSQSSKWAELEIVKEISVSHKKMAKVTLVMSKSLVRNKFINSQLKLGTKL